MRSEVKVVSSSLQPHGLYSLWNSSGQNTSVGSCSLLQGIFPTQGSHCRWILYQLSHQKSPRIVECVAYPFSRESFWPRNWSGVFCIAGGFFTSWATWDVVNEMNHNHIFLQQRNSQRSVIIYNLSIWNLYMLWFPKVFNQRTPLSHLLTAKWNTSVFLWQCCKKWSRASIQRLFTAYLIYAKVKILGTQDAQKLQLYRQIFIPNII